MTPRPSCTAHPILSYGLICEVDRVREALPLDLRVASTGVWYRCVRFVKGFPTAPHASVSAHSLNCYVLISGEECEASLIEIHKAGGCVCGVVE